MKFRKSQKITKFMFLYMISIFIPPFLIVVIILNIISNTKEKNFQKQLKLMGFNDYIEIDTGVLHNIFLFLNSDGRFLVFKKYGYQKYDIRDFNVDLVIPDNSKYAETALVGYMLYGKFGALLGSKYEVPYLLLRDKGNFTYKEFKIYGESKALKDLYNYLEYYREKGYI